MRKLVRRAICLFFVVSIIFQSAFAQGAKDELAGYNDQPSRLRGVIEKFDADVGILNRYYSAQTSPNRSARFKQLYNDELDLINRLNFDALNHDEQIDYLLFRNYLEHEQKELARRDAQLAEMAPLMPFARTISDMEDTRRTLKDLDPAKAAVTLNDLADQINKMPVKLTLKDAYTGKEIKRTVANRAARTVGELRNTLKRWYTFYNAYDPLFT